MEPLDASHKPDHSQVEETDLVSFENATRHRDAFSSNLKSSQNKAARSQKVTYADGTSPECSSDENQDVGKSDDSPKYRESARSLASLNSSSKQSPFSKRRSSQKDDSSQSPRQQNVQRDKKRADNQALLTEQADTKRKGVLSPQQHHIPQGRDAVKGRDAAKGISPRSALRLK